mmetsp:Transcript_101537/g.275967  ORF Transcript_101537/g.275967 Transcript_101537/m.275967 type:complete len:312 (-) Transcript_101537:5-940(-)
MILPFSSPRSNVSAAFMASSARANLIMAVPRFMSQLRILPVSASKASVMSSSVRSNGMLVTLMTLLFVARWLLASSRPRFVPRCGSQPSPPYRSPPLGSLSLPAQLKPRSRPPPPRPLSQRSGSGRREVPQLSRSRSRSLRLTPLRPQPPQSWLDEPPPLHFELEPLPHLSEPPPDHAPEPPFQSLQLSSEPLSLPFLPLPLPLPLSSLLTRSSRAMSSASLPERPPELEPASHLSEPLPPPLQSLQLSLEPLPLPFLDLPLPLPLAPMRSSSAMSRPFSDMTPKKRSWASRCDLLGRCRRQSAGGGSSPP